jgi:sulfatase maturation enzyme AslB (radical SAM superfamily)
MEKSTNVIYITSKCNLNCEYCYEKENRPDNVMTNEEIDAYFDYLDKHSAPYSHIVLFGGEPLLYLNKIEYILNKIVNEYSYKHYSVSMNTNGILLLDDKVFNKFLELNKIQKIHIKISYDGSHSFRRIDYNGNCVNDKIEQVMEKLRAHGIKYAISYTWHKDNDKTIVYDIIEILEKYNPTKIEISTNCSEIDSLYTSYLDRKKELIPYMLAIYLRYKIPICDFTCSICRKCVFNSCNIYGVHGKKEGIKRPKQVLDTFSLWNV